MNALEFQNLTVVVEDRTVLKDLSLVVPRGEIHALMGPNGTGKSSLAKAVAGHPSYEIASGDALLDGKSIVGLEPDKTAQLGLFMAFQYPSEIPGVSIANFIRAALVARLEKGEELNAAQLYRTLYEKMDLLQIDRKFTARSVNEGFSGGEKKRCEILQMLMLKPTYAIMDETDSGLDIDALKVVANGINLIRGDDIGILIITHYQRLLNYIVPDRVHVLWDGRIVRSGGKELALELEEKGYNWIKEELAVSA
jgi:Fe-S cluster assembly ATP-binding protein